MSILIPSTDGVSAALHHLGGTGPVVVFCHATGFHARVWDPIAEALADRYDCWSIDLRGHGDSVLPEGTSLVWTGMAADILACVDHIRDSGAGEVPFLAVGHSMGGASIVLAELARPGTFDAAYLFEPILFPSLEHDRPKRTGLADGARRRRELFESFDAAYERYASRPPLNGFDPRALRAYVDHGFREVDDGVMLKCRGATEAAVFDNSDNGAFARLGEVQTRLVIAAGGEQEGPAVIAPVAAEAAANATLQVEPTMTHFGPLEHPDQFAVWIDDHFRASRAS